VIVGKSHVAGGGAESGFAGDIGAQEDEASLRPASEGRVRRLLGSALQQVGVPQEKHVADVRRQANQRPLRTI
jgi:hypothetical protein